MKQSAIKAIAATQHAMASKVYGKGLWTKTVLIFSGLISNAFAKPLPVDTDPRKLEGGSMYWVKNKFGDTQLLLKYADGGWSYAGVVRDKDGDLITSEDNTYEVHEVVANSRFEVPDTDVVIEKGFTTLKAYAI